MLAGNEANIADLVRDNPAAISAYLTEKFAENEISEARTALSVVMKAQNVQILARDAGLRRDALYRTFGGRIDPQLSRILKMFAAMNVRACVAPKSGMDSPDAIAARLNEAFGGDPAEAIGGLSNVVRSQNVTALALKLGIRRTTVYKTFGGAVDPHLSRVLNLFVALEVRLAVLPAEPNMRPPRPSLGRPRKLPRDGE
ncbi:helix-turn-helix domain-containing transcriptional regulator [Bradyrhizobium ottawaense]|uniref:helix-turn-helix domain-containing transcriptional regulator n=1 Tax=Bradyrhizobium ottawaense TaxID=931866 RepID=UPI001BAE1827|nr:transcriptional regulator [Bradyrhizobium ottawaense]MBR1363433.1 transcriptional regulator [Bradyrhizobium ottawaense]